MTHTESMKNRTGVKKNMGLYDEESEKRYLKLDEKIIIADVIDSPDNEICSIVISKIEDDELESIGYNNEKFELINSRGKSTVSFHPSDFSNFYFSLVEKLLEDRIEQDELKEILEEMREEIKESHNNCII